MLAKALRMHWQCDKQEGEFARYQQLLDKLFKDGNVVYKGYSDDTRNTDNAWMETTATHFHCETELAEMLPRFDEEEGGGSHDGPQFAWLDINEKNPRMSLLFAGHSDWVRRVAFHTVAAQETHGRRPPQRLRDHLER